MLKKILLLLRAWKELDRFEALEQEDRRIVFYSESLSYWIYFEYLVRELTARGAGLCYLTSDPGDPLLKGEHPGIRAFYIGEGPVRTLLFQRLKAKVMVLTMPDLENLFLKRSRAWPVHYVYVFHALVSTHMTLLKGALDHYDTILCAGPHQAREIRLTEKVYGLRKKNLVEFGYGRLDKLLDARAGRDAAAVKAPPPEKLVLIAPSWGSDCLLETGQGAELARVLLAAGYSVVIRPHPCTLIHSPDAVRRLEEEFRSEPRLALELDIRSQDSFFDSCCLISDWSGVGIEYAFVTGRPVLYIDTPPKIKNPAYKEIPAEPIDFAIRGELGAVIAPDRLEEVPQRLQALLADADALQARLERARAATVFNPGRSSKAGADAILKLAALPEDELAALTAGPAADRRDQIQGAAI